MKVGAVAVAGLATAAVKTGMDFDAQMSRVGAISGATKGQLSAMKVEAIDLGAKTAFSAKEAAQGMENLSSAGFTAKETMSAMPGVLNLAAVSGGDVALASEDAATALRGFGLSAGDAGHVADVFAEAAAKTNAEASDMGEALKMVAPQAHAAGISLEETSAAVGVLSDAGIKGSMAGSNLGMALTKVQNPSAEAAKAMKQLGFNAYDSSGKMKPLATQVDELKGKMSGMTDQQKAFYTSQIYGVQGGRAMNVLLAAQAGKLQSLTRSLQNSNGAAEKMADQMQNNLKSSIEQFGGALESLAIVVEEAFAGSLRSGVDAATSAVGKFTKYIQANEGSIRTFATTVSNGLGKLAEMAPSLDQVGAALKIIVPPLLAIETFKGIGVAGATTVKMLETMQADLSLVRTGLTMTGAAASSAGKVMKLAFISPLTGIKDLNAAMKDMPGTFSSISTKAKSLGSALITNLTNPKQAALELKSSFLGMSDGINGSMVRLLKTVGASDDTIAALTNTVMKNGTALGTAGQGAKGLSASMLQGSTSAGGLGASLGALLPIAAAVALVAGSVYAAWSSNFLNIRGVVDRVVGGIGGMFDSMRKPIDQVAESLKPLGDLLGDIFKVAGVGVITAVAGAAIMLATALRLIVDALAAIVNTARAAFYGLEGLFQKLIPGGEDGAKAMNKAGAAIKDAGGNVMDMGSAFKDAFDTAKDSVNAFGDSSKEPKKVADAASISTKQISASVKQMKTDLEASKTDFSQLIDTSNVSAKTKEFLTNVNTTLDQYQANAQTAADKYGKAMTAAEKKNGQSRINAVNEANQKLAVATQKNGLALNNITADLDRQLKAKRFSDGTAMTADQVNILTDQNNQIKQKLLEQNQIYVQAQLARLQNGQKLNQQEQQATVTTLQANYAMRQQQITLGEAKITQLNAKIAQTKDITTKAQLQQELATQTTHNQQMMAQQTTFGTQMNLTIANGQKLNYTTWSTGLQSMKNVTTQQLQSMLLSFMQMNSNTGQQMQAFALMLQRTGTKGVGNLVKALQDGTLTAGEASKAMSKGAIDGLQTLPPNMFTKGSSGRTSFINALKKGDFVAAGKYLADGTAKGADQKSKHGKSGKDNGDAYAKGVKGKKGDAQKAGSDVADSSDKGAKSKKNSHKSSGEANGKSYVAGIKSQESAAKAAGKALATGANSSIKSEKSHYKSAGTDSGKGFVSGVKGQNGAAKSAGKALANQAKSGVSSVSLRSVGSQLAAGVASGIRGNTGSAVAAMRSLVNQVNAEAKRVAKIHSPSHLMRDEVGRYLSLGIAEGITDYASNASDAMGDLVGSLARPKNVGIADQIAAQTSGRMIYDVNTALNMTNDTSAPTRPLNINLNLDGTSWRGFVADITRTQDVQLQLQH